MARAALRLVSSNYETGSVDAHLKRSLLALPVCLAGAWLTMLVLPEVVDAGMHIFGFELGSEGRQVMDMVCAAAWVGGMFVYRMTIWGTVVASQGTYGAAQRGNAPAANFSGLQSFRLAVPAAARGDNRHPLNEIYAIGFTDAVRVTFIGERRTGLVTRSNDL